MSASGSSKKQVPVRIATLGVCLVRLFVTSRDERLDLRRLLIKSTIRAENELEP